MEGRSVTKQSISHRMEFSGCEVAASKECFFRREYPCVPWICVEGYDTSLPRTKIEELLRNHFGSCGHINRIFFSVTPTDVIEGHKIVAQARSTPLYNLKVTDMAGSADTVPAEKRRLT